MYMWSISYYESLVSCTASEIIIRAVVTADLHPISCMADSFAMYFEDTVYGMIPWKYPGRPGGTMVDLEPQSQCGLYNMKMIDDK